jgi:hypothetical protein
MKNNLTCNFLALKARKNVRAKAPSIRQFTNPRLKPGVSSPSKAQDFSPECISNLEKKESKLEYRF